MASLTWADAGTPCWGFRNLPPPGMSRDEQGWRCWRASPVGRAAYRCPFGMPIENGQSGRRAASCNASAARLGPQSERWPLSPVTPITHAPRLHPFAVCPHPHIVGISLVEDPLGKWKYAPSPSTHLVHPHLSCLHWTSRLFRFEGSSKYKWTRLLYRLRSRNQPHLAIAS